MSTVEDKLNELGFKLPESAPPLFNYVPYVVAGNMVFIAGQVPIGGDQDANADRVLGEDAGDEIWLKAGRFGPYVQASVPRLGCRRHM